MSILQNHGKETFSEIWKYWRVFNIIRYTVLYSYKFASVSESKLNNTEQMLKKINHFDIYQPIENNRNSTVKKMVTIINYLKKSNLEFLFWKTLWVTKPWNIKNWNCCKNCEQIFVEYIIKVFEFYNKIVIKLLNVNTTVSCLSCRPSNINVNHLWKTKIKKHQ